MLLCTYARVSVLFVIHESYLLNHPACQTSMSPVAMYSTPISLMCEHYLVLWRKVKGVPFTVRYSSK